MKKLIVTTVLVLFASAATPVSADVKEWLKARVPGVEIEIPNPMSRTRKPAVAVEADGNGVRRTGKSGGGDIVVAGKSSSGESTAQATRSGGHGNRNDGGVVIVPPDASSEAPDFNGTTVAVNWFNLPARVIRLEDNIQKELAKRGASFAFRSDTGNPCNIGQRVICFVVERPVAVAKGSGSDRHSNSRSRRSSSSSSSSTYGQYVVTVRVFLVKGDGSEPLLLAEKSEDFTVTGRQHESWSYYSSRSGRRSSSSGSSSYSLKNGELAILSEAARQAEGEIKYLLKEKSRKDWAPGATELVAEAFRR